MNPLHAFEQPVFLPWPFPALSRPRALAVVGIAGAAPEPDSCCPRDVPKHGSTTAIAPRNLAEYGGSLEPLGNRGSSLLLSLSGLL